MSATFLLAVGLLLCFAGALSVWFGVLEAGFRLSWLLAVVFVSSVAVVCGFLDGLNLDLLYRPTTAADSVVLTLAWVAVGLAGHAVRGNLSRRRSKS